MGELSFRFSQIRLPRHIYKDPALAFGFKIAKLRKPLRYSLVQLSYAFVDLYPVSHHVRGSLSLYNIDFG